MMVKNAPTQWFRDAPGEIRFVGKYKNETSVYIIGTISRRGPSIIVLFNGHLNQHGFQGLCAEFLIPFVREIYPDYHRIHLDNATHHVAQTTANYFSNNNLNRFLTPAQSPDLNPVELVWNDLKNNLGRNIKPNTAVSLRLTHKNILQLLLGTNVS